MVQETKIRFDGGIDREGPLRPLLPRLRNPGDNRFFGGFEGAEDRRFDTVVGKDSAHPGRHLSHIGRQEGQPADAEMLAGRNECRNGLP